MSSLHAALEMYASRYLDPTSLRFAEMLADGLVKSGLCLGPALDAVAAPAFELTWQVEGEEAQKPPASHPNGHRAHRFTGWPTSCANAASACRPGKL